MDRGERSWPTVGLEPYIPYACGFNHLNVNLGSSKACASYFSRWMARYRSAMSSWGPTDAAIWCIRSRQSLKSAFTATHFAVSARRASADGSLPAFYYLSYYAVFHAMWSVMFLHPDERSDAIVTVTHSKLTNTFQSAFSAGTGAPIAYDVRKLVEDLRFLREYYTYRFPMNSPFEGNTAATSVTSSVGDLVRQCIQLSNLHSHIAQEAAERERLGSATIPVESFAGFTDAFFAINSHRHQSRDEKVLDPADQQALGEFLRLGYDLVGHSILFEHHSDQYMTYAGNGAMDREIRSEVVSLVYDALS